jgi:chromosome segregation ATPase
LPLTNYLRAEAEIKTLKENYQDAAIKCGAFKKNCGRIDCEKSSSQSGFASLENSDAALKARIAELEAEKSNLEQ